MQVAVQVKIDITDGGLKLEELNRLFAEGYEFLATAESTPGSILVIVKKDS